MLRSSILCLMIFALISMGAIQSGEKESIPVKRRAFGTLPDQRAVTQYTLQNSSGVTVDVIDYGATITRICVPDRNGVIEDVALGYDTLEGYVAGRAYMGAVVGRYGNRIGKGTFSIDGQTVNLALNDGANHIHGGRIGFDKVLWAGTVVGNAPEPTLSLCYVSPDGEEGYPGTVTLEVRYILTERNELRIEYEATTDKPTVLNPTQHSYFNLTGNNSETILGHRLRVEADAITEAGPGFIPTGRFLDVAGTPLDFREFEEIGARIGHAHAQMVAAHGYDHTFVLRGRPGVVRKAAEVYEPGSGRTLTVYTDQPGMQLYTGNFLSGIPTGKGGVAYRPRTGLCLETQAFPDTPNKPQFPQVTLRPGQTYRQTTLYHFSIGR